MAESIPRALRWEGGWDGKLWLIDQTRLPAEYREVCCSTVDDVWQAIRELKVRGAPAIGVAAAYGVVLGMQPAVDAAPSAFRTRLDEVVRHLSSSRPTAVNLFWALERMKAVVERGGDLSPKELVERLLEEARAIEEDDRRMCRAIGENGAELVEDGTTVLTHCNAGSLATAGDGTALAVLYAAVRQGKRVRVFADETRPLLQGARLTAWELKQRGVPVTVVCDNMAGWLMRQGRIGLVLVGADRIAANGDTANKIGTYSLAVLARAHAVSFVVAAPSSTFDLSLPDGRGIPIEERSAEEITHGLGRQVVPDGVPVYNPAFDVTPAELITAIVTERGVVRPVERGRIAELLAKDISQERSS